MPWVQPIVESPCSLTATLKPVDVDVIGPIGSTRATVDDSGRIELAATELSSVVGWELKAQGLCRDDTCVPAPGLDRSGNVDLLALADALRLPVGGDAPDGLIVLGPSMLEGGGEVPVDFAPEVELEDLMGEPAALFEAGRQKRMLVAFASW